MVGMLKDQPHNQVNVDIDKLWSSSSSVGLQDGMLAYYLSQAPLTEEHESGIMAREYFNLRDMLEPKK
jgi:hypothetical protein